MQARNFAHSIPTLTLTKALSYLILRTTPLWSSMMLTDRPHFRTVASTP